MAGKKNKRGLSRKLSSLISSGTYEVRAKREPSLCNESVKRHFWFFSNNAVWDENGNLLLNPIPLSGTS